jgi:hypothetical protein
MCLIRLVGISYPVVLAFPIMVTVFGDSRPSVELEQQTAYHLDSDVGYLDDGSFLLAAFHVIH